MTMRHTSIHHRRKAVAAWLITFGFAFVGMPTAKAIDATSAPQKPLALQPAPAPAVVATSTPAQPVATAPMVAPATATPSANACVANRAPNPCAEPPLLLDTAIIRLPSARVGRAYRQQIGVTGGRPPYQFKLVEGTLPNGLQINPAGQLEGIPVGTTQKRFRVAVNDEGGQLARQEYVLTVLPLAMVDKPKPTPEAPAKPATITAVSIADAQKALPAKSQIETYVLTQKVVEGLKAPEAASPPPAPAPAAGASTATAANPAEAVAATDKPSVASPPAGSASTGADEPPSPEELSDDGIAQLKRLLQPIVGVEYPNRGLFTAALDAQVCQYAAELTRKAAQAKQIAMSPQAAMAKVCPASKIAPAKPMKGQESDAPVPLADLPSTLLPPYWRSKLIDLARQHNSLLGIAAPQWQGSGCGCLMGASKGDIYAFFPNWHDPKTNATIDFGLFERISLFAQPFDEDGNVTGLKLDNEDQLDFLRAAHNHGTKVDLTLYRGDWDFLRNLNDEHQEWVIRQIAVQAVRMVDAELPGWTSQWHSWLPGPGYGQPERVADGISLYLDNAPRNDKALGAAYARFRNKLILALIAELKRSKYPHTLNLMINQTELLAIERDGQPSDGADADDKLGWDMGNLLYYLIQAEEPRVEHDRIVSGANGYQSNTSLTLRYVVLISAPSSERKRQLQQFFETSPVLHGESRRVMLRKVLPLESVGDASPQQLADNMSYYVDNFGGAAFWPRPIKDPAMTATVARSLRATFLADEPRENRICTLVCEWHWPLRAIFLLMLLVGVISFALYLLSCRARALGRPYQLYLILGCIPPLLIGGGLLQCDPGLAALRQDHSLLLGLIIFLLLSGLIPLLKPRVEKP
ncbi:MAG: hypothetical protein JO142_19405 [Burkholderiales bacterium]|nr:hypothetical protein [Burkholderiales bacterium]